jgi:hypothetical protein
VDADAREALASRSGTTSSRVHQTEHPQQTLASACSVTNGKASHARDLRQAVETGLIHREDVTQLGDVLAGTVPGRCSNDGITIFDSTELAIQDLAIARSPLSNGRTSWTYGCSTFKPPCRCLLERRRPAATRESTGWSSGHRLQGRSIEKRRFRPLPE